MEREQVSVKIDPGSTTATEINPIPQRNNAKRIFVPMMFMVVAKPKPRKFEIDYSDVPVTSKKLILNGYLEGAVLQAEVLDNGKIRIL